MKVDFYSTKYVPDSIKSDYTKAFSRVLNEDSLIEGSACRDFEEQFATYLNSRFVLGVGNGFDAIKISLQALGIKEGDRVAVPAHTFIATWYAVQAIGAVPIGIDVDLYGQIDLALLELEKDLKCVIPVHMHGTHCDMKRLTEWAKNQKVFVLEDCAQAAGLEIQGRKAGTWGDIAAFSFYPTKNLFALGDGGAICTSNERYFEEARLLSRYGSLKNDKYTHVKPGQNSRLDSIQASILSINLRYLDEWNAVRQSIAENYRVLINDSSMFTINNSDHIYHHFVIHSNERDNLRLKLSQFGIGTEMHYPFLAAYESDLDKIGLYKMGEFHSNTGLSLPISPWQTQIESEYVATKLNEVLFEQK